MFPIIEVAGSSRERGHVYGAKAHVRIDRSIATYSRLFAYCGIDFKTPRSSGRDTEA